MKSLRVDGGASANNYLMQTMADVSDLEVKRPRCVETTALGAAIWPPRRRLLAVCRGYHPQLVGGPRVLPGHLGRGTHQAHQGLE